MSSSNPSGANATTVELVSYDYEKSSPSPLPDGAVFVGEIAHHEGSPNFGSVAVLLAADKEVLPGQFLCVTHRSRVEDTFTVIQVGDCLEVNPNEMPELSVARSRLGLNRSYVGEGVSTRIYRLALCETIEEITVKPNTWTVTNTSAPQKLPRSGDVVFLMPREIIYSTIGTLPNESDGLNAGETFGAENVQVTLKPQVLQMGTFVGGNPGKGKSYFCGVLVEEAYAWDIPTLVLDVNGEMIETAKSLGGMVVHLPDAAKFGLTLNLITPPELISITPGVQPGTQYADLIALAHEQLRGEVRNGAQITIPSLIDRIVKLGEDLKMTALTVRAATSRIGRLEADPLIGKPFDFIASLIKHKIVVLDCRQLSVRQTQLIAAAAARILQAYGRKKTQDANISGVAEDWFSILFVDEAHIVAPSDGAVVSTQVIYELARMGRHVRTGLILSSQSPSDLDSSVLKRLQTRFVFALEKDQLKSISGINADLSEKLLNQLPKLPRSVCAVSGSSELINHGFLLQVRKRKTPVGGSTPKVFEARKKKISG